MGVHVVYEITWIDDCTYRIRPTKVIKGDPAIMGRPGDFVTVKILEVREKSYIARATSNFADFELDLEVEIVD
jgi:hypothetical protein